MTVTLYTPIDLLKRIYFDQSIMWYLFFYIDELALSQAAVFIEDAFKVYQF